MKITRQTKTTLQFQSNPVWWAILGFAFMGGVFLYNANSKSLVLNKNSQKPDGCYNKQWPVLIGD